MIKALAESLSLIHPGAQLVAVMLEAKGTELFVDIIYGNPDRSRHSDRSSLNDAQAAPPERYLSPATTCQRIDQLIVLDPSPNESLG